MYYFSAASLCAAGIATLLKRTGKPNVTVGVDGSVYRFHPTFPRTLRNKIAELIPPNLKVVLVPFVVLKPLVFAGVLVRWGISHILALFINLVAV